MIRLVLLIALMFGAATALSAQERSSLWPEIPAATGAPHPEGNEYWRRNHMNLMRHDRDQTMRDGNREVEASLKGCFDCHAAADGEGTIVTYESDKHFCRSCHDFVAVKVDCFMCHRSTPEGVDETADEGADHAAILSPRQTLADIGDLVAYLKHSNRTLVVEAGQ